MLWPVMVWLYGGHLVIGGGVDWLWFYWLEEDWSCLVLVVVGGLVGRRLGDFVEVGV